MNHHRDGGGFFNRLPFELWLQILNLIPARSLVVLRTTCKSFLRIINDPEFVSSHLQYFPGNLNETRFLTIQRLSYQVRQIATSDETLITTIKEQAGLLKDKNWRLKGSLDGLLLLKGNVDFPRNISMGDTVLLWNPSIKKFRHLPDTGCAIVEFGLGYDNSCRDYKVVAMPLYDGRAWVYSVKTGSCWVEISNSGIVCQDGSYSKSLSFKNGVFWVGRRHQGDAGVVKWRHWLVWFDFGTERFRYSETPYSTDERDLRSCCGLLELDGGSSVGVWGLDAESRGSVWALESNTMSWTRRYKIVPDALAHAWPWSVVVDRVRLVERSGELVLKYWVCVGGSLKSLSYNIKTERIECVEFSGMGRECLHIYIESLVML